MAASRVQLDRVNVIDSPAISSDGEARLLLAMQVSRPRQSGCIIGDQEVRYGRVFDAAACFSVFKWVNLFPDMQRSATSAQTEGDHSYHS